jgi:N-carbamoylputrescine amidase
MLMSRIVKGALLQATYTGDKGSMIAKHVQYAKKAAEGGAQVMCFQEIFYGPYFCQVQDKEYYTWTESIPDGPTTRLMQDLARETGMVLIVPMYEVESPGIFYNTAAIIDADGSYLGKYRKTHIPHLPGTINRVGIEADVGPNDFYGQSYFCTPRGEFVGEVGDEYEEELLIRDLDLDLIQEVRETWQFYRDRRPDMYGRIVDP